ncbi:MAG: hypothetical protein HYY04_09335, partial [Chloroflexi bacterium]|nr:hypothetical protein [Chloroflexota bacterium]
MSEATLGSPPDTAFGSASAPPATLHGRLRFPLPQTIRGILVLLLAVVFIPLGLVQTSVYYNRARTQRAQAEQTEREVARAVAMTFDAFVQDILHAELTVGMALTSYPPPLPDQVDRLVVAAGGQYSALRSLSWVDARGHVLAASLPADMGGDVSGTPYLQEVVQGREW